MMFNSMCRTSLIFKIFLLVSLVWLTGCSAFFGKHGVFRSRGNDYLAASAIEPLQLPAEIESVPTQQMYRIPSVHSLDEFGDPVNLREYKVPRPLPMGDKGDVGVKIQKLSGSRWIYLNASTAQVWPRTQYFLSQFDLAVAASNASAGLIETDWLQFKDDTETGVRFQIKLSKGMHPETTEIHVLQMQRSQASLRAGEVNVAWPQASDDPKREAWLLEELANTLAETVDNNAASLLGQNVGGDLKAGFVRFEDEPTLQIRLTQERAWATVAHSANKEGFKTWEADAKRGVIYLGYAPYDEDGPGFFSSLSFWSSDEELPEQAAHSLQEVLSNLSANATVKSRFSEIEGAAFSDTKLEDPQSYLLVLYRHQSETMVNIRNAHGERLPDDIAKDFLRLLRKNLI